MTDDFTVFDSRFNSLCRLQVVMNILFLSNVFPDSLQRARGTYNFEMCRALHKNHDVRVVAPRSWYDWAKDHRTRYVPSQEIKDSGLSCEYPLFYYVPGFQRESLGQWMSWSIKSTCQKVTQNWKPDLVLSYWAHPDGEAGYKLAEQVGCPSAVIIGGSDVLVLTKSAGRKNVIEEVLHKNTFVLTVSDGLKHAVEQMGIPAEKVHTIRQGIYTQKFFPTSRTAMKQKLGLALDRPVLLWVGRMVGIKGLPTLLDAVRLLKRQGHKFQLVMAGNGPYAQQLQMGIRDSELSDDVKLLGSVSHDQLPAWYQASDICVLSSLSEGLPNVLREALACGTPFVSTDVGSISEIASPEYSELVPVDQPELFAQAILKVINGQHQSAAAQYQPRTWEHMADDIVALLTPQKHLGSISLPTQLHVNAPTALTKV
jgi:glycosyltransferase involved in cell wall biosynthesis